MRTLRTQTIQTNFLAKVVRLPCGDYTTNPERILKAEIQTISLRLAASKRALGIVNTLAPSILRTRHKSRIMGNMKRLRAHLNRLSKQLEL